MIFGVAMSTLFVALGFVATLVGCGRTSPARLDGSVTNAARPDAAAGNGRGGAGGAGGTWRGTGGTTPPTVGSGGLPGSTGGSIGCSAAPGDAAINFCKGRAQGAMTGSGWVALGDFDTLTSPVCDNTVNGGGVSDPITKANPCPPNAATVWSAPDALCFSGDISKISRGEYGIDRGIQMGWNTSEPPGATLCQWFTKVAFVWSGDVTPAYNAIRGEIHRAGDAAETSYCAYIRSGQFVALTDFNTKCWDKTGVDLTADDVPFIDKMGVQMLSDEKSAYTITDFCLTDVYFDELPVRGAGGTTGNGGSGGAGGGGRAGASGSGGWAAGTPCPPAPLENAVNFCKGRAQGEMTGWGWVAMGSTETLTSPICGGTAGDCRIRVPEISLDHPCPSVGGQAAWSAIDALCISGSIPVLTAGYTGAWGMLVGWNANEPADTPLGRYHSQITFTWRGTTEPTHNAIRGEIHRKGDAAETSYCATIRSGEPISLLGFNTKCWDKTGVDLTVDDIPNIDWIGVEITADDKRKYSVNDFCVTGIYFDEP